MRFYNDCQTAKSNLHFQKNVLFLQAYQQKDLLRSSFSGMIFLLLCVAQIYKYHLPPFYCRELLHTNAKATPNTNKNLVTIDWSDENKC